MPVYVEVEKEVPVYIYVDETDDSKPEDDKREDDGDEETRDSDLKGVILEKVRELIDDITYSDDDEGNDEDKEDDDDDKRITRASGTETKTNTTSS